LSVKIVYLCKKQISQLNNHFPTLFVDALRNLPALEVDALLNALCEPSPVSVRYNARKQQPPAAAVPVPWCSDGVYLTQRPVFTLDPLLHAGAYYVQEASSMFLAQLQPFINELGSRCRALDLCAAPGGKSTLLAGMLPDDALLVCNEVIRPRAAILQENMSKWGFQNIVVTSADPQKFGALSSFFDMLLIDAPCSGEGLFRKDPAAIGEWSSANVALCAERQRRIVADAWDTLREGGLLVYSTCTFNRRENEENIMWITKNLGAELLTIPLNPAWGVVASEAGYRFYPHKVRGEGFFVSVMRKTAAPPALQKGHVMSTGTSGASAVETSVAGRRQLASVYVRKQIPRQARNDGLQRGSGGWLRGEFVFEEKNNFLQAIPAAQYEAIAQLQASLPVRQAGVPVGEQKGNDLIPAAALALSTTLRKDAFPCVDVDLPVALRYLRRENVHFADAPNGLLLVCYNGLPLGFAKKIGARTNNNYPPAWRIRMNA